MRASLRVFFNLTVGRLGFRVKYKYCAFEAGCKNSSHAQRCKADALRLTKQVFAVRFQPKVEDFSAPKGQVFFTDPHLGKRMCETGA